MEAPRGYPTIESPHPIDIHESAVTAIKYIADEKNLFLPMLLKTQKETDGQKDWPIGGGEKSECCPESKSELIITGKG